MRFGLTMVTAMLAGGTCGLAGTLTDPFGQLQDSCAFSLTPPYSNCEVIGNAMFYDVQKATVSMASGTTTVAIYTNSGGVINGKTLGAFSDSGLILLSGDIFFYNPAAGYNPDDPATLQNLRYGIAMTSHGSLKAGDLYSIAGDIYTETAEQALNNSSDYYRRDETVLLSGSGRPDSEGALTITRDGDGVTNPEYVFTVTVPTTPGLLSLVSNGEIGLLYSSADCGNDVIQGSVDVRGDVAITSTLAAPEPGPGVLVLTGLALLQAQRRWRKRKM